MPRWKCRWLILSSLCLVGTAVAQTQPTSRTFELNSGRFTEVPTTNPASLPRPDAVLKRVQVLLDRNEFSAARNTTLKWLLAHKGQPNYDQGLYLMAQAANGTDDPLRAFYFCDELMDGSPASAYFKPALDLQYSIGDSLLNGRTLRVFGVPFFNGSDEGVEIMFRVQQRSPGSPLAQKALRRTADHYFNNGDFDLAADAYGAYVKNYSRDPDLPEILVRQAFANYAQFTGLRFDPTPLVNARAQMEDLINKYPDIAKRENIESFVTAIDKTLARKLLVTADYYQRVHRPESQKLVLNVLTKQYPQTDEAQQARRILGEG